MTKGESAMVGFEIVAYAGDARSKLVSALKAAEDGKYDEAEELITAATKCMDHAHQVQTEMLQAEARGEEVDVGFIMIHGQDHLMTTMLLKDVISNFITLYKRTDK
jgi:PTS system lactose-specific IIA component